VPNDFNIHLVVDDVGPQVIVPHVVIFLDRSHLEGAGVAPVFDERSFPETRGLEDCPLPQEDICILGNAWPKDFELPVNQGLYDIVRFLRVYISLSDGEFNHVVFDSEVLFYRYVIGTSSLGNIAFFQPDLDILILFRKGIALDVAVVSIWTILVAKTRSSMVLLLPAAGVVLRTFASMAGVFTPD